FTSHDQALKFEEEIYSAIKEQLLNNTEVMQTIASTISTIDCLYSLAKVAVDNNYNKPIITTDSNINIVAGRHPIIEKVLKTEDFIPNDCKLNNSDQRTMILTGPNMAGKSTYMRQVALITYMAHLGSFVPAQTADICIVDRIFTRIGASDDLSVGQSTFMVEMVEVANILNYSTNKSLIILDEVGRGTSTFDGLSIAWAVVEYLSKKLNAKTLFATHYHELMQLEGMYEGVKNFCISIKEIGGKLVFLRKIMRGSATRSYGIEVASLAGLPTEVVDRAKELLTDMETNKTTSTEQKESELLDCLKEIDINTLTPLVAFDTLTRLIDLSK
ncbi:MAG: DNA mismatch repair protein MutS, partial [Clostridia bacterium]|nr:DNA mismatch repair protein MutS [Clostridia bacterium]